MLVAHANEEASHKKLCDEISKLSDHNDLNGDAKFDLTFQLQTWEASIARLGGRIKRACQQLAQKD
jgi:hypothetical protein